MSGLPIPTTEADLEPRIISIGTTRVLRIKQVGLVYFVENDVGRIDEAGVRHESWKPVAVSKPSRATRDEQLHAYAEAHRFLHEANGKVMHMIQEATRRARPA